MIDFFLMWVVPQADTPVEQVKFAVGEQVGHVHFSYVLCTGKSVVVLC